MTSTSTARTIRRSWLRSTAISPSSTKRNADFPWGRGTGSRPSPADAWVSAATTLGEGVRPRAGLLTGDHLIAAGMSPGPQFRPLLAAALAAQDEGSFSDERGALAWLAAQD